MRRFVAWKLDLLDRMSTDPRLSATDFRVGYRLLSYMNAETGACFPKQETIADDVGVTDRTIRLSLVNLRACGWLKIEERQLPKGRGKSNFYLFEGATTGNAAPVNDTTNGKSAQDLRKTDSSAPPVCEHIEGNTKGEARKHATPERGTRLPENFSPDLSVALAEGMTVEEAQRSALNFLDYWKSKPGAAGRKLDWNAAWRLWARKDAAEAKRRQRPPHIAEQALAETRHAFMKQEGLFDDDAEDSTGSPPGYIPGGQRH
ncbi:helix-turn-helix domain-containing protein [Sinorhizobium sp. CCBAU 05631]|uniref:helix-turn-helix domain-containing protein n=1 Tax=Sinorhizobium sp. CCBAU 05631 TaxID=794846 RepID=UPI0006837013|nr:helix-turn-helix domain-containing protein [Sinorhizobium sp. CCBAU 05631]ASY58451.1 Primosomal protein I [Sinorhizobium sp. CCBAU 05631]